MIKKRPKKQSKKTRVYVTTDNLDLWGGRLQEQINQNTGAIDKLSDKVDHVERIFETVLFIVEENNELIKSLRRLPDRVERLEKTVYH